MVACVLEVLQLYGCEFPNCVWLVAPLDLQFLQGCFFIFPTYDAMTQVLDCPSKTYLCRGPEEFVFQSGSLVLLIPGGHEWN